MNNDVMKKEDFPIQEKPEFPVQEQANDIANIISNEEMKDLMEVLLKEFDGQREEAMDAYYIFKDMVINSGDFDSSQATKEALTNLLKNAQDASNSKMRIFESLMRSKMKQQTIEHAEIKQNNVFMTDRRSLLKELERMKEEETSFSETIEQVDKIGEELESLHSKESNTPLDEDKKEENIKSKGINNDEEVDFEIESGDFE